VALSTVARIDLLQISYFVTVAEELNVTRAARRLNVAQQSLSSAVARLESHLGFALFERSNRAVALTERGSHWPLYTRELLAVADRCATAAHDLSTSGADTLRGKFSTRKRQFRKVSSTRPICIDRNTDPRATI
jgi:DNA-binding transcriptional LysR family regulator